MFFMNLLIILENHGRFAIITALHEQVRVFRRPTNNDQMNFKNSVSQ